MQLSVLVLALSLAVGVAGAAPASGCTAVKKAHGWVCACSAALGCDTVPGLGSFDNATSYVVLASSEGGSGDAAFTGERLNRTVRSFATSARTKVRHFPAQFSPF